MKIPLRVWFVSIFLMRFSLGYAQKPHEDASPQTPNCRPNIIFILADDMGYGDVNALNPACKIRTPHLDTLAAAGMHFTDMHSPSSVCTPTRYSILTGRYNWRSRLKSGVLYGYDPPLIEPQRATVATMLKQCGYHTAVIGKWHLGLGWAAKTAPVSKSAALKEANVDFTLPFRGGPTELGFDYFFGIAASLDMPPYVFLENDRVTSQPTVRKKWLREGLAAEDFEAVNVLPELTQKAVTYLESRADDAKTGTPFFLFLPLTSPHTPIVPAEPWKNKSGLNDYADFVMQTDATVGAVMETVQRLNLSENTIIIFTSDNGCSPQADFPGLRAKGHDPSAGFRGMKADIFEGGHHVPFLVSWPGVIRAGSRCDQLACLLDFMGTCAEIVGSDLPEDSAEDTHSLLSAWQETAQAPIRTEVVHHSINGSFAIRQGVWKLCLCPDSGGWSTPKPGTQAAKKLPPVQLYHLKKDATESKNRQAEHPERIRQMESHLKDGVMPAGRSLHPL